MTFQMAEKKTRGADAGEQPGRKGGDAEGTRTSRFQLSRETLTIRPSPRQPKAAQTAMEAMNLRSLVVIKQILTATWQELWGRDSAKHLVAFKPFRFV